jgi:hypothetical protein
MGLGKEGKGRKGSEFESLTYVASLGLYLQLTFVRFAILSVICMGEVGLVCRGREMR